MTMATSKVEQLVESNPRNAGETIKDYLKRIGVGETSYYNYIHRKQVEHAEFYRIDSSLIRRESKGAEITFPCGTVVRLNW